MFKNLLLTFLLFSFVSKFAYQEENKTDPPKLKQYYFVMIVKGAHRDEIDSLSLVKSRKDICQTFIGYLT